MRNKKTSKKEIKKLTVPVNTGSDHIQGPVNEPITIVEYGDYECPYTDMAYSVVKEVMRQVIRNPSQSLSYRFLI